MIGDSRPSSLAGVESSGAADLVTAAPTAPIYQLILDVMHYQLGSRESGLNIAKETNHSNAAAGFRGRDGRHANLTVSDVVYKTKQAL